MLEMKWSSSLLAGACAISLLAACAPMAPSVPQSRLSEDPAELDKTRAATQLAQTKSSQPDAQAAQVFLVNNPLIVQPAMQRELAAIAWEAAGTLAVRQPSVN
jgi:hypothetical protein